MRNSGHIETTPLEADVFIVGGGPAGLSAAIAARQKGPSRWHRGQRDADRFATGLTGDHRSLNPAYRTFGILCAIAFSVPVQSQSVTLNLDPARTQIAFTLGATFHTVDGSFKLKSGAIQFNPATGEASGDVVVDASSGESGNNSRDRKMHKSVLGSQNYPEIVFVPERVQGQVSLSGESHVQIQGLVKLHGSQHEIALPADIQVTGNQLTANLHFAIPYVEWGLRDPSTFVLRVEKKVDMAIHVAGSLSFPPAAH